MFQMIWSEGLEADALLRKKSEAQRGIETRQRGWWCSSL